MVLYYICLIAFIVGVCCILNALEIFYVKFMFNKHEWIKFQFVCSFMKKHKMRESTLNDVYSYL